MKTKFKYESTKKFIKLFKQACASLKWTYRIVSEDEQGRGGTEMFEICETENGYILINSIFKVFEQNKKIFSCYRYEYLGNDEILLDIEVKKPLSDIVAWLCGQIVTTELKKAFCSN